MPDSPAPMAKVFELANLVIRPVLASQLHRILSNRLMLLHYRGGRTGKTYTFAVGYFDWYDGSILAFSSASWPRALPKANDVRVLIKRRWRAAQPYVVTDDAQKADILEEFIRRNGTRAAKGLILGLPGGRQPSLDEVRLVAAAKTTIVRFALT